MTIKKNKKTQTANVAVTWFFALENNIYYKEWFEPSCLLSRKYRILSMLNYF